MAPRDGCRPPERWECYNAVKDVIEGTRFLPFKTPFKKPVRRDNGVVESFNVSNLFERVGNLGLVVNLLKTTRYYNSALYKTKNITHYHLSIDGQGRIPSDESIEKIFRVMDSFVLKNASDEVKLIGVHCTHGVNRTGYIICRYMIRKLGFEPEEAIRRFEAGRGHKFDHPELADDLRFLQPAVDIEIRRWHSVEVEIEAGNRASGSDFDPDEWEHIERRQAKNVDGSPLYENHEGESPRSGESVRSRGDSEGSAEEVSVGRPSEQGLSSSRSLSPEEPVAVAVEDTRELSRSPPVNRRTSDNQSLDDLRIYVGSPAPRISFRGAEKHLGPRRGTGLR